MASSVAIQSWTAFLALGAWPFVALWLYRSRPVNQATLLTILWGYLLLPAGAVIKPIPGIPQLDKVSIPAIAAFLGCLIFSKRKLSFFQKFGITEALIAAYIFGPLITSELNGDPTTSGAVAIPGVGIYDGLSTVISQLVFMMPFFLGRTLFRESRDIEEVLRAIIIAALVYSLPILFEVRMSPQLHYWFYGYYPSQFSEEIRWGGFRPMVFIGHGLGVAFFTMTAVLAATAFWRTQTRVLRTVPSSGVWCYLNIILIFCKGLGSLVYAAITVPLIRLTTPKLQVRLATVLVSIALLYPLLRTADLVPVEYLVDMARPVSSDRADSLQFRFDHEKALLDRASQRRWFGWGRFGRSRIFDDWGNDVSVSDGGWIITLGQFGIFGFIAQFGLFALSVLRAASALRYEGSIKDAMLLATLAIIVAITQIDELPDAALTSATWLYAGALLGRSEALKKLSRGPAPYQPGIGQLSVGQPHISAPARAPTNVT